ncbi:hypothetical protein DFH28DRAFT_365364 [Melampsora americana]|nr:hypothetical protein DFH28DRAFT_365364 [Melampsora americana]
MTGPANSIFSFLKELVYPDPKSKSSEPPLSSSEGGTMSGDYSGSIHPSYSNHIPTVLDAKQGGPIITEEYGFTNSNQHVSQPTPSQSSYSAVCNELITDHLPHVFFSDTSGTFGGASALSCQDGDSIPYYTYSPQATLVLGSTDDHKCVHPSNIRRCFNCGDAGHALAGCQEPRNEALIRLSRQIFQTQKLANSGEADEDCNQVNNTLSSDIGVNPLDRQKELAASFFPGQVSAGLREALFWDSNRECADPDSMDPERPMPWYNWFEKWGYPPGYAIFETDKLDPFEAVTHRLAGMDQDHAWASTQILEMHRGQSPPLNSDEDGYDSGEEVLRLLLPKRAVSPVSILPNLPLIVNSIDSPLLISPPPLPSSSSGRSRRLRIVKYSGARFCHDHLPVYNGQMLKRKQTCKCLSPANYPAETSKSRYSEEVKLRQPLPTRLSSSRRFSPYPPTRPSHPEDGFHSQNDYYRNGVKRDVDVSPEPSTALPRSSHPHPSSAADTTDKFFDGRPRGLNSRSAASSHAYSQWQTSPRPWRSSRNPRSADHSNATPGSSIFRPSFHRYTSPSLISPSLHTRNKEMTNVPTDEDMAWYTALLPDYSESMNPSVSAPIPQATTREPEPSPKSEDMVMSDESDE